MIPKEITSLFKFIDYLETNKAEYIEKYLPLCDELMQLDIKRSELKPRDNYVDKKIFDAIQKEIVDKFKPINEDIYLPVLNKLKELEIWAGDDVFTSIWNNNASAIYTFKENFSQEDVDKVMFYKQKYLSFRKDTNSNFLCLQIVFSNLDEILKELFDFFKDTNENEFASFEAKVIKVNNIEDAVKGLTDTKGANVRFEIPQESLFNYQNVKQYLPHVYNIKNEFIMGHRIKIGDIGNNSGQIVVGNGNTLFDSASSRDRTADIISKFIDLITREKVANYDQEQAVITNFNKIKEEIYQAQPSKSKIFEWLTNAKSVLQTLVLSHEAQQALEWIYENLNFS